jgi:hypothetical protein
MKNPVSTVRIMFCAIFFTLLSTGVSWAMMPKVYDVTEYGAVGDGNNLDSPAINKAIEQCVADGGGTVYLPPGTYLCGSIRLKSNVTLHIGKAATIMAAPNEMKVYDIPDKNPWYAPIEYQDFGHSHWKNSLIWAIEQHDIGIVGEGTLDGSGMTPSDSSDGGGDKTIGLKLCRNILIKDITIKVAGHFGILPTGCDNMVIDNLKIDTNRDGINIDCCKNVRISNCTINSPHDDAIVLKSSYGLGYKKATEDVTISNCMVSGYKVGSVLDGTYQETHQKCGRIKLGTESNGGFKNIAISNCVFDECLGLAIECVDGGIMENITVSNIVMRDIYNGPILLRLGNRARGPNNPPVGRMRNINISNIVVIRSYGHWGNVLSGIPGHLIENVRLNNITISYVGGGKKEYQDIRPPEKEADYPELVMFGMMPSYGFYLRHIKDIQLNNISVSLEPVPDPRPALVCDDVDGLVLNNFRLQTTKDTDTPVIFRDTRDLLVYNCPQLPSVKQICTKIRAMQKQISVDEKFLIAAQVLSKQDGLSTIEMMLSGREKPLAQQYLWLNANEPKEVLFKDVTVNKAGRQKINIAGSKKNVGVTIKP